MLWLMQLETPLLFLTVRTQKLSKLTVLMDYEKYLVAPVQVTLYVTSFLLISRDQCTKHALAFSGYNDKRLVWQVVSAINVNSIE